MQRSSARYSGSAGFGLSAISRAVVDLHRAPLPPPPPTFFFFFVSFADVRFRTRASTDLGRGEPGVMDGCSAHVPRTMLARDDGTPASGVRSGGKKRRCQRSVYFSIRHSTV